MEEILEEMNYEKMENEGITDNGESMQEENDVVDNVSPVISNKEVDEKSLDQTQESLNEPEKKELDSAEKPSNGGNEILVDTTSVCYVWLNGLCPDKEVPCSRIHDRQALIENDDLVLLEDFPFFCPVCDISFEFNSQIKAHVEEAEHLKKYKEMSEKPNFCNLCSSLHFAADKHRFSWLHRLNSLVKRLKTKEDRYCNLCQLEDIEKVHLKYHFGSPRHVNHMKKYMYHCEDCDYYLVNEKQLENHKPRCISKVQVKKYVCETCIGIEITSKLSWDSHLAGNRHKKHLEKAKSIVDTKKEMAVKNVGDESDWKYSCAFCPEVRIPNELTWECHINGKKHLRNVEKMNKVQKSAITKLSEEPAPKDKKITTGESPSTVAEPKSKNGDVKTDASLGNSEEKKEVEKLSKKEKIRIKNNEKKAEEIKCSACKKTFPLSQATAHFTGKKHHQVMQLKTNRHVCDICEKDLQDGIRFHSHVSGKKHLLVVNLTKRDTVDRSRKCVECNMKFNDEMKYGDHLITSKHKNLIKSLNSPRPMFPPKFVGGMNQNNSGRRPLLNSGKFGYGKGMANGNSGAKTLLNFPSTADKLFQFATQQQPRNSNSKFGTFGQANMQPYQGNSIKPLLPNPNNRFGSMDGYKRCDRPFENFNDGNPSKMRRMNDNDQYQDRVFDDRNANQNQGNMSGSERMWYENKMNEMSQKMYQFADTITKFSSIIQDAGLTNKNLNLRNDNNGTVTKF